jgi:hypothetical protein
MVEQSISLDTSTTDNRISQPEAFVNPSNEKTFEQKRTETTTNRELLANALESTIDTSTEEGKAVPKSIVSINAYRICHNKYILDYYFGDGNGKIEKNVKIIKGFFDFYTYFSPYYVVLWTFSGFVR